MLGDGVTSFTFRGFFDEKDYVEPKSTLNELMSSGKLYVIIASSTFVLLSIAFLYLYRCCTNQGEDKINGTKKQKTD